MHTPNDYRVSRKYDYQEEKEETKKKPLLYHEERL